MPWHIETDNPGCRSGYAVVKDSDGSVAGCHTTRRDARAQLAALNASEYRQLPDNYRPALSEDVPEGRDCGNCRFYDETKIQKDGENLLAYCTLWEEFVDGGFYCDRWASRGERSERQENYKPTEEMVVEARRGLEWRAAFGRGGTEIGVARARDIINRRNLSYDTVVRMRSFFARHEVDKDGEGFSRGEPGYPSAGRIAWALWGGDSGRAWAERIIRERD